MKLKMSTFEVKDIKFGNETSLKHGVLTIDKQGLINHLMEDDTFANVDVELVFPGESCRIIRVVDAVEPRYKPGNVLPYAGCAAPVQQLGEGETYRMEGVAVLTSCAFPLRRHGGLHCVRECILDMTGPMADVTPFSKTINVLVNIELVQDKDEDMYERSVRYAGAKAARYIGLAMKDLKPENTEVFSIDERKEGLPNVAYVYQKHSVGLYLNNFLYDFPFNDLLPVVLNPNEILDGAIVDGNYSHPHAKCPTYYDVNNPIIKELYKRHGKTLNFVGVIFLRGRFEEMEGKKRCSYQVAKTAEMLGCDGVVVTWTGAGNAFIETMLNVKYCEQRGIKAALGTFEMGGAEGVDDPLFYSEKEADAIVSFGSQHQPLHVPAVERVAGVGGKEVMFDPEDGGVLFDASAAINRKDNYDYYCGNNEYGFSSICRMDF